MPAGPVGIFAFGNSPLQYMVPLRTRALLAEAALQDLDLVFFSADDCKPEAGEIEGTRWSVSGWTKETVPVPKLVLVINEPFRERDRQVGAWLASATRALTARGPDKADLPTVLADTPVARYLIPQRLLPADDLTNALDAWLAEHGASVIKPADGMRGGGIRTIEPAGDRWRTRYRAEAYEGPMADVVGRVAESIAGRMAYRRYIVQRLIDSTLADGRATAIRVDVHKTPQGGWLVTKHYARLSDPGHVVANLTQSGYQAETSKFLSRNYRRPQEMFDESLALALATAEHMDRHPDAAIFELGVDILVDGNEKLWLVEANVRPQASSGNQERAIHHIAYLRSLVA
jgi:glutathione synthase/RimK-type ligase-like ATP-grasp enzyme